MEVREPGFWRVVTLRKGKVKPVEFQLREGEVGLSVIVCEEHPNSEEIVEAVRLAGKRGDLASAFLSAAAIHRLGLRVATTPGGTPVPEVNEAHRELRIPWPRRLLKLFARQAVWEQFNAEYSASLYEVAKIIE